MIKLRFIHNRNSPEIDDTPIEFNTQSKVDGFGLSNSYNSIGPAGDPFRGSSSQPRHAMEEKQCEMCGEIHDTESNEEEVDLSDGIGKIEYDFDLGELEEGLLYEKKDRCYYLAKQKYDVFPSAYASGYIVRCRKGKVGRKKNKNEASDYEYIENLEEDTFDKEKSQGLHGWFARKGGKGKSKGWVDCNTCRTNPKTGRKTCKTCGRQSGEERGKYPACRPTPSACTTTGMKRKKNSLRVSWKKKNK